MNEKIEEKKRLNKTFEIFDTTFEKFGLQLMGKGINCNDFGTDMYIEILVNDKNKIDNIYIIANMYDSDDCIMFHEEEYVEKGCLEDLFTTKIYFHDVKMADLKSINKIRIYLTKAN